MKVLRLDLEAFGPFTGASLDFSEEGAAFHVVYGPNEAGKSTALRALRGLLFGIPETTPDAHVHPSNKLRVGALLEAPGGVRLEVVRKWGRKNTLRGPGDEALDPDALAPFLRGIGEEAFERLFGLDHERLRKGATALVEGEGEVGRTLFDAGLGGRAIAGLLERLEEERRAIWSPRASKPLLNAALAQLKKAQARVKADGLAIEAWTSLEGERKTLEAEIERLGEERRRSRAEQRRLERIVQLVPLAAEHVEVAAKRRALGDGPLLAPEAIARRRELSAGHEARARFATRAAAQRDAIARDLAEVTVDAAMLALSDEAADALTQRLAAYRRVAAEGPARAAERALLEERILARLRALGRGSLEEAERARPSAAALARLRALGGRRSGLEQAARAAREALARVEARFSATEARLAALGAPRDLGELERAVDDAKREGDLRARLDDARRALEGRRRELDAAVRALAPFEGSAEELGRLRRPLDETVERLAADDEAQRRDRARVDEELADLARKRADLARDLDLLLAGGEPPSEDELRAARERRDALLAALRAGADARGDAGDALAVAIRVADHVADRLRAEAARVAEKNELVRRSRDLERRSAEAESRRVALDGREAELRARLAAACAGLGVVLRDPGELRGFLRRFDDARACAARVAEAEEVVRGVERLEARLAAGLADLLGEPGGAPMRSLLDHADRVLRDARDRDGERRALLDEARTLRADRADCAASLAAEEGELESFHAEWTGAVRALGLDEGATTEEVDAILELLSGISADAARAAELGRELEAAADEAKSLARAAAELAERHAPDLVREDVERQIAELVRRHREARAAKARADGLLEQLSRLGPELAAAEAELAADERELATFCAEAGAPDVAALAALEDRSEAARSLDAKLASIEASLARLGDGRSVEALLGELEGVRVAEVGEELAALGARIDVLAAEEKDADQRLGAVRVALEQARERSAEDAAAEVESYLAEASAHARRYVRASLAAAILRSEIERYRRSHEGPILAGARAMLPRLTLGRYRDLRVLGAGEAGSLRCVREGGAEVAVESLSDGTRDQLFLALRLAAIAVHAREEPPPPLVLDDVFIHFDDARARAGLEILGELAGTTQVLFFTHHARLVELAREAVSPAKLRVHALARPEVEAPRDGAVVRDPARVLALEHDVGDRG